MLTGVFLSSSVSEIDQLLEFEGVADGGGFAQEMNRGLGGS
jgi:hypothetical protein